MKPLRIISIKSRSLPTCNVNHQLKGVLFLVLTICLFCLSAQAQYGGGMGNTDNPYLIYEPNQMQEIGANPSDWNKHFKLMADVDLSSFTGTQFNIIGNETTPFTGTFDGNGYKISNFTYKNYGSNYSALFGYVDSQGAEIKNLGLVDPNVDAGSNVGSLVSYLGNGSITGCYAEAGSVSGNILVGGLVGYNKGTISNCYATASVLGTSNYAGGLVGYNTGTVSDCYATASIAGNYTVGGLVGYNLGGTVTNCYTTASVSGTSDYVGGLVGNNSGTITKSYTTTSVSGNDYVGGLAGGNGGDIYNCYSAGSVTGNNMVGGLVGVNIAGFVGAASISNCYSQGDVSGGQSVEIGRAHV